MLLGTLPFKGRAGWGWCRASHQIAPDHFDDLVGIVQHVMIPESQHVESIALQKFITCSVGRRLHMLTAVDFYDKSSFEADEVQDEVAVRMLSPKLATF